MSRALSVVEPDDIALARYLGRLRRRVRLVLLARYGSIGASLAAAIAALALVSPLAVPTALWTTLIALAVGSALVWALVRTPRVGAIAALVDDRLHLADSVVMAAALRGNREPIARLIVRNTLAHLTDERLASVFPFALGRSAMVSVAAAVACVIVVGGMSGRRPVSASARGSASSSIAAAGSTVSSKHTPSADGADAVVQQAPGTMPGAQSVPDPTTPGSDAAPQETTAARRGTTDERSEREAALPRGADGNRPPASRLDRAANQAGEQEGASPRAQSAQAGGTGAAGEKNDTKGSGGVQQGALQPAVSADAALFDREYRAAYRDARSRVDTAVARDEVPRRRRAYVRDYFLAIAPRD